VTEATGLTANDIGVTVQGYDADISTVSASQAEMEAGTESALRSMSPLRVKQAIDALAPPVTIADSTSIDLTLTGQQISAAAIFGTTSGTVAEGNHAHASLYQPLDADLTAIAVLSGTSGLLKKTAADTWTLDTTAYTTNLGTVTSVGLSVPTGLSVSSTPVTTSGTIAVSLATGYSIPTTASQSNWDTAYTDRLKWDGGSTGLTAATGRTSLGATTVGGNLFTLANPSAITFPRINADNTVSTLDAASFRTAIGAGTSSTTGTVTSVSGTGTVNGLTLTGTVTSSGSLTLGGTLNLSSPPAIGGTTPAAGTFTTLGATGNVTLGDASGDTVAIRAGTAALPTLIPNGDPNTGLWFPAADTVAWSTAGSERLRIDSAGNVGIGTNAPSYALDVLSSSSTSMRVRSSDSGLASSLIVQDSSTNSISLQINGSTAPIAPSVGQLRVTSGLAFTLSHAGTERMYMDGSGNFAFRQNSNSANTSISLDTTVQNALTLDSSGNVGIGQPSPAALLDVNGAAQVSYVSAGTSGRAVLTVTNGNSAASLAIGANSITHTDASWGGATTADGVVLRTGGNTTGGMALYVSTASPLTFWTNSAERLRIDESGNVGIGTTTINVPLQFANVAGTAGDPNKIRLYDTGTASHYGFGVATSQLTYTSGNGAAHIFYNLVSSAYVERLRIDGSGNVGIATSSFGTSATNVLGIKTGTAPSTGVADTIQIFSTDLSAGNTILSLRTEGTGVVSSNTGTTNLSNRIAVRVNGTVYYLLAASAA
jgi:hypothetical protein